MTPTQTAIEKILLGFGEHMLYQDARGHGADPGTLKRTIQEITLLLEQARAEERIRACDYIYDKINEHVGAPENPDYQLPDAVRIVEIIDEARHLSQP